MNLLVLLQGGYLFASEKIYTVLTVVLIILAGFITLLLLTNRRISRLEREVRTRQSGTTDSRSSV